MVSARLTPAAATRINTSPAPGTGIGRDLTCSASAGPGSVISMTRMIPGIAICMLLDVANRA